VDNSKYSQDKATLFINKCHITRNLRGLILPWLSFRLYVYFKDSQTYGSGSKGHFYGEEQQVTYSQCLNGKVKNIVLSKETGYQRLVDLLEKGKFKRKFISAQLYSKSDRYLDNFDILHREYHNGKLVLSSQNDPFFKEGNMLRMKKDETGIVTEINSPAFTTLFFSIDEKGRLQISEME